MNMVCEEIVANLEEGSPCPQDGCDGIMGIAPSKNCSCHINPPCSSCTDAGYVCGTCGWESAEPYDYYEPEPYSPARMRYAYGSRKNEWTYTHTDNPYNSTPFTRCCGIAAIGTNRCPNCLAEIVGHDDGLAARRREVGPGNCLMCWKKRGPIEISGNCCC